MYTNNADIIAILDDVWIAIIVAMILECIQSSYQGIFRGLGLQKEAMNFTLMFMYPVSIPLAFVCCFVFNYRLKGLLLGFNLGNTLLIISYEYMLYKLDWME